MRRERERIFINKSDAVRVEEIHVALADSEDPDNEHKYNFVSRWRTFV